MSDGIGGRLSLLNGSLHMRQGWQELIKPANPAAGATFTRRIPGETWERYVAVTFTLTASAVVANRQAQLRLLDADGAIIASVSASGVVVAGTTVRPRCAVGLGYADNNASGHSDQGMWDILADSGWQLNINVTGMDAGDTLTDIVILAQRFPTDVVRAYT